MGCCCGKDDKYNLHIKVESAENVPNMDIQIAHKTADPFVEMHYGKEGCCWNMCNCWTCCFKSHGWVKTEVQKDNLNPVWNEWFTFRDIEKFDEPLIIKLKDWDKITKNDVIFKKELMRKFPKDEVVAFTVAETVKNKQVKLHMKAFLSKRDQAPLDETPAVTKDRSVHQNVAHQMMLH